MYVMHFHQKCNTVPKALTRDDHWKCDKCTKFQQNRLATSTNCQLSKFTNLTPSQPQRVTFPNKIKVYQLNTGGILPKFLELRNLPISSDIDVLAL